MPSFLTALLQPDHERHVLVEPHTGVIVADRLLTAFASADRNKGLLGRDSLPERAAMIIAPCTAVHTFFMRFSIDIAFVAKDGRVLKVRGGVRPWRIAAALGAFAVIELPAGALQRAGIAAGATLAVRAAADPSSTL